MSPPPLIRPSVCPSLASPRLDKSTAIVRDLALLFKDSDMNDSHCESCDDLCLELVWVAWPPEISAVFWQDISADWPRQRLVSDPETANFRYIQYKFDYYSWTMNIHWNEYSLKWIFIKMNIHWISIEFPLNYKNWFYIEYIRNYKVALFTAL